MISRRTTRDPSVTEEAAKKLSDELIPTRRFQCSYCGETIESQFDLSGNCHDVTPSAKCSGMTSLFEILKHSPPHEGRIG